METQKHSFSSQKILVPFLFALFVAFCGTGNSFAASNPPASFMKLPINVLYSRGVEGPFGSTIDDLVKYGLKPESKKTWEKMEADKWILTVTMGDAFSGNTTILKMLFVVLNSPNRAVLHRMILNGTELYGEEKDSVANQFLYATGEAKKQK